jgi:hypothetical protein
MKTMLYTSHAGPVDVETRGKWTIYRTTAGIMVERVSVYGDEPTTQTYYKAGQYPVLPDDWTEEINEHGTTAADAWLHDLEQGEYTPYRHLIPSDREPRELLGMAISATAAAALRRASTIYKLPMSRLLDKAIIDAYGDLEQAP